MRKRLAGASLALATLLAACGGGDDGGGGHAGHEQPTPAEQAAFGEPGTGPADRTVELEMGDYFFKPRSISVAPGETVRFVAENVGEQPHQLVIGDLAYHEEHGTNPGGAHVHDSGTSAVDGDGSVEITWTFPEESADLLIACHVADHYTRGMIAPLKVE